MESGSYRVTASDEQGEDFESMVLGNDIWVDETLGYGKTSELPS